MKTLICQLTLLLSLSSAMAFDVAKDQTSVKITADGKPVMDYRFTEVPFKPYVAQLYTPGGVGMLRDSPSDHKHHHALMFAIAAEGVDFWTEHPNCGKQVPGQLATTKDGLTQKLDWTTPDNKVVLAEDRSITVHPSGDSRVTLLSWRSKLQTPAGKDDVKLTGSHYFGLGMRFVTSMDNVGTFINSSDASGATSVVVRGTERLTPVNWCACSGPVDSKTVTVAIFDHPSNLRHPARMFTMSGPFSYLSATLNLWKEPYVIKAAQPLTLTYGVAAWDGKIDAPEIEKVYQKWLMTHQSPE